MEYISAEEFLKQDVEVQQVLLNWWQPSLEDLYCSSNNGVLKVVDVDVLSEYENEGNLKNTIHCFNSITDIILPLLSEGQLRKFIKDKCLKIEIQTYEDEEYTLTTFLHGSKYKEVDSNNLLQAYWEVTLEISRGYKR